MLATSVIRGEGQAVGRAKWPEKSGRRLLSWSQAGHFPCESSFHHHIKFMKRYHHLHFTDEKLRFREFS